MRNDKVVSAIFLLATVNGAVGTYIGYTTARYDEMRLMGAMLGFWVGLAGTLIAGLFLGLLVAAVLTLLDL